MTRTQRQAPGVARLEQDEGRTRRERVLAYLATPADPFPTSAEEQALFIQLKREGALRAKAGFGDVRPYLEAYKHAVRERFG